MDTPTRSLAFGPAGQVPHYSFNPVTGCPSIIEESG
jgi:hypothetical protein